MDWKEVFERIEDQGLKETIKSLTEGKSIKEIELETQKRLVKVLVKLKAAQLLELMKRETPFKAVRKEVRKALETLKAFGVVAQGGKKRERLGGWIDQPYGTAVKVSKEFGKVWVGISIPEGGGFLPMILLVSLDRRGITDVITLSSDRDARKNTLEFWKEIGGVKEFEVKLEHMAPYMLQVLQETPVGLRLDTDNGVLLNAILSQFHRKDDSVSLLEDLEKELETASGDGSVEFSVEFKEPLMMYSIRQQLEEILKAKTIVDEEQRDRLVRERLSKALLEEMNKAKGWFKAYLTLLAYALYKDGGIREAREALELKKGMDAPELFDVFSIPWMKSAGERLIEEVRKGLEEKENEDKYDEDEE